MKKVICPTCGNDKILDIFEVNKANMDGIDPKDEGWDWGDWLVELECGWFGRRKGLEGEFEEFGSCMKK